MHKTKIKICGLFWLCDATYVNEAMPDFAGFVFYEDSHRYLTEEMAQNLRERIHPTIQTVGVFVDVPIEQIVSIYQKKIVSIIQLHGKEDDAYIEKLRAVLPQAIIWKAYKVRSAEDVKMAKESTADMVLLDNGFGTGVSFDWSLVADMNRQFILAGGLTSENICKAIEMFCPYAVDLSTGVETKGVKDKEKMVAAVEAVKRS